MKIACDNPISFKAIKLLEEAGYDVVYWAQDEHDELWFSEAVDCGAKLFVSSDTDIETMAINRGLAHIALPEGLKNVDQGKYILEQLRKKAA